MNEVLEVIKEMLDTEGFSYITDSLRVEGNNICVTLLMEKYGHDHFQSYMESSGYKKVKVEIIQPPNEDEDFDTDDGDGPYYVADYTYAIE